MNDFWVTLILASLVFGFNIGEVKNTITKTVGRAMVDAWTGNLDDRNIFKRRY